VCDLPCGAMHYCFGLEKPTSCGLPLTSRVRSSLSLTEEEHESVLSVLGVELPESLEYKGVRALLEVLRQAAVVTIWEPAQVGILDDLHSLVGELEKREDEKNIPEGGLPLLGVLVCVRVIWVCLYDHPRRPEVVALALVFGVIRVGRPRRHPGEASVLAAVMVSRGVEHVVNAHLDQLLAELNGVHEAVHRSTDLGREEHVADRAVVGGFL